MKAVIFDLDGVIVSTDELHYEAWKWLADEEGIPFSRELNARLRGVSRMESLEILLERAVRPYTPPEKSAMAERKNDRYRSLLGELTPSAILPGAMDWLADVRRLGLLSAIGSSSKNAPEILERIGLATAFDAVAHGGEIQRSKPDPEVFLLAAGKLGVAPSECLVVEDAEAGVEAALAARMAVLAVGSAAGHPRATVAASGLDAISAGAALHDAFGTETRSPSQTG